METFTSGAVVIEAGLLSSLLALWITWLVLSGLFRLMPFTSGSVTTARTVQPIRFASKEPYANRRRDAA